MLCEELDALLAGLALADVDRREDHVRHAARIAALDADHQPGRVAAAIAPPHLHLALPRVALLDLQPQPDQRRAAGIVADQRVRPLADQLGRVVARRAAQRAIDADDAPLAIDDDDALRRGLEHLGPQRQALLHLLQMVDRREGGEHRILPLVAQAPCRQHRP